VCVCVCVKLRILYSIRHIFIVVIVTEHRIFFFSYLGLWWTAWRWPQRQGVNTSHTSRSRMGKRG